MFRTIPRRSLRLAFIFLAAATLVAPAPGAAGNPIDASSNYFFQGLATDWLWALEGHPTLADGNHADAGHVSVIAACLDSGSCEGEFTFVGALGTATCRIIDGAVSGTMDLYLANSFLCENVAIQITGTGVCDVRITAVGLDWGIHTARGDGMAAGGCESG